MSNSREDIVETEIPVWQLAIGMHVTRLDRPWEETNFLLQGFIIQNEDDLLAVQEQCETVFVEGRVKVVPSFTRSKISSARHKSKKIVDSGPPPNTSSSIPKKRVTYINKVDTRREVESARVHYDQAKETAKSMMAGIRLGRMLDMNRIREAVDGTVDSVLRNENALLLLSKMKNRDEYTAEHCINVAILSAAFGKHMGLLEKEIRVLTLCGMMHDIGKMRIDDSILNKPAALTPEEFAIMKQHTTYGRDLLLALPNLEHAAVDVAFSHHERMDGMGYPRGLSSQQIPLFAKMVGLVDTYDAITSSRVYDKGRASMKALQVIHANKGAQFDEKLALEFIRMIGIYPPGSIVEMENGEVGIVVANTRHNKLRPVILLVRNSDKQPITPFRQINLSNDAKDASGNLYKIAHEIPDGTYDILISEFVEGGFFGTKFTADSDSDTELSPTDDGHGKS